MAIQWFGHPDVLHTRDQKWIVMFAPMDCHYRLLHYDRHTDTFTEITRGTQAQCKAIVEAVDANNSDTDWTVNDILEREG